MADLERWEHDDQEKVAIRREEMTCKGCRYLEPLILFGSMAEFCVLNRPSGKRCRKYKEQE